MESTSGRRNKLVIAVTILTGCYWLAMFAGTHWPIAPDPQRIPNSLDKLQHLTAFAGLALLLCTSGAAWGFSTRQLLLGVLGLIAVYGVFDELTQAFVPHREPDIRDWLANMLGAGLGATLFLTLQQAVAISRQRQSKPA